MKHPHSYSLLFRQRVLLAIHEQNLTQPQAAKLFAVGRATIARWLRLERETGSLLPKSSRPQTPPKIHGPILEWLKRFVDVHPDSTLKETQARLAEEYQLQVGIMTIDRALRRLGFTRKKKRSRPTNRTPSASKRPVKIT